MKDIIYQLEQTGTKYFQYSQIHIAIELNQSIPACVFDSILKALVKEMYVYNNSLRIYLVKP